MILLLNKQDFIRYFYLLKKEEERLNKTITDIYHEVVESEPISPIVLTLMADDIDYLPTCRIYF